MLTLFATGKPFREHSGIIQRNALQSWKLLHPDVEVILFGDDSGAGEICGELGLRSRGILACFHPCPARREHLLYTLPMSFTDVEIARVRDYWNSRPCNIRHSTAPIGTKEYFDQVEARKYFVEYHIPAFAEFHRWRGKKVLEIGCGIGTDTINFARAGAQVTTVDLSDKSMELARTRASVFGLEDRIRFCPGNAEQLSTFVPVQPYDLIYCFGVIHHTPHPEAVLDQLRQYARPGTTIKVMVYHRRSYKVAWILLSEGKGQFWKLSELVAKNSEAQTGCPVTYTYTRREGRQLLERHGFRVTDVRVEHIFPYRTSDYVKYQYVKEWYFRWMPQSLFRALERRFGWHLLLTAQAP